MKISICTFLFCLTCSFLFPQSGFKQFSKLSRPEKCWVMMHPFKAVQAMRITKSVLDTVDSIKKNGSIGSDISGGRLDAFKHAYWMASLAQSIGSSRSLKLGKAHEKGNYLEFKKHKLEDSLLPDSVSSEMDLRNNAAGVEALKRLDKSHDPLDIKSVILNELKAGRLFIIKKDKLGNYLYCDGTFIDTNEWARKWNIPKCLIPSDKE